MNRPKVSLDTRGAVLVLQIVIIHLSNGASIIKQMHSDFLDFSIVMILIRLYVAWVKIICLPKANFNPQSYPIFLLWLVKIKMFQEERFMSKKTMKERLQTASRTWGLTKVESIYVKEKSAVFRADSTRFGSAILKIGGDAVSLASEFSALTEMKEKACCQVYDFDDENVLLLEERISPGTALKQEPGWERRAVTFAQVFEAIHVAPRDAKRYNSYLNWVKEASRSVQDHSNKQLAEGMCRAVDIAVKMFAKYPERVLLHGDLHHENIVRNVSGNYVVIDPKGVVGPPIFDIPRFLLNELDEREDSLERFHINRMIEKLSYLLGFPADDIYQLFFMEIMLANTWLYEDGEEISERDIKFAWSVALEYSF